MPVHPFNLTMTHAGWNACQAAMTAQLGRNPGTRAVSYLYGQEAATGRWIRLKRTTSADITERWHNAVPWQGYNPTGGHRASFNQTNYMLPHPQPPHPEYNNFLQWTCFFWQLSRLSGAPVPVPPAGDPYVPNHAAAVAAHATRFGPPTPEFHDCESVRQALPVGYFAPEFRVVVYTGPERQTFGDLICAFGNLPRTAHGNVHAKCVAYLQAHPAGDTP
jgi:hypothetical protein